MCSATMDIIINQEIKTVMGKLLNYYAHLQQSFIKHKLNLELKMLGRHLIPKTFFCW